MAKKTFFKIVRRAISKNFGRFVAIIAIVALGVGFLTGLLAATPNMKRTIDTYFDSVNMADLEIKTSSPFSADDITALQAVEGVEGVMPAFSLDLVVSYASESPAARLYLLDLEDVGADSINRLELVSGRMPLSDAECLVERSSSYFLDIRPGQTLECMGFKFTVSGVVGNPWYFSSQRESTSAGNGKLETVVYVDRALFEKRLGISLPNTNVFVTVAGAKAADTFTDKYEELVKVAEEKIQSAFSAKPENSVYVLGRDYNLGFTTFEAAVEKVAAVAVVFPAFFFLVAALVALTSMTRMVEDERGQIGTLKSLGYSNGIILLKYVIYALVAGAIGCGIGVLAGFQLLPAVIWNAYKFMFHLPKLQVHFNWLISLIASLAALLSIVAATMFACVRTLREKPAQLLQPRSPKPGGHILLERVKPVWSRLKFKYKSTVRNLFRYKKHFIMTIVGVGGCTALMLTGFGMSNSTNAIVKEQYEKIYLFDLTVTVGDNAADDEAFQAFLNDAAMSTGYMSYYSEAGSVISDADRVGTSLIGIQDESQLPNYVNLYKNKKTLTFDENSVVLSRKAAEVLKLSAGDTFTYESTAGKRSTLTLSAITENYVGTMLYVGSNTDVNGPPNAYMIQSPVKADAYDDTLTKLLACDSVQSAQFTAQEKSTYDSLVKGIGAIVVVLIVCAGALAVIVLYNLININIIERTKELATLKVLGYRPGEIAGYIMREIVIMTIVGILVGLLLGIPLHYFVIMTADTVQLVFGRTISWWSYLASAAVTLAFSAVVDLIMCIKLRRINMAESMKASE